MPTKSDINHVLSEGYRCLREEKWTEGSLSYLQTASRESTVLRRALPSILYAVQASISLLTLMGNIDSPVLA